MSGSAALKHATETTDLVIVGGGIGGLTLAVALERRGLPYLVLERAAVIDAVGAGLLLAPNATRVLRNLGLLDGVLRAGHAASRWRILDDRGRVLRAIDLSNDGLPGLSIHRTDLQRLLLDAVPSGRVRLSANVTGIAGDGHAVAVTHAGGVTIRARAVVGADGVRSSVRAATLADRPPVYRGYVGWRGVAHLVPSGYEGMLSESWGRGGRFGIAPIDAERTYWYASANRPRNWVHPVERRQRDLLAWFGGWHDPIADLIRATPTETILCNDIVDRPPRRGWSHGHVTLLGDAAHPMTPNLGQGACSAIEDAWVLARELSRGGSATDAFARYEQTRYPRTAALQRQSLLLGHVVQVEPEWALGLRRIVTRALPGWLDRRAVRWIFEHDVDAD